MRLSPVFAIVAMSLAFASAQALSYPLLSILQKNMGLSPGFIGFSAAMTPLGILVSSFLTPRLFARFGLWRMGVFSGIGVAAVYLALWAVPSPLLWLPLRFAIGFMVNFQFMVAELSTLTLAPAEKKGRYVAGMAGLMQVGFATGPALLAVTGVDGFAPFGFATCGFLVCALVVWLAREGMPTPGHDETPENILGSFWLAPVVLGAIMVVSAFEQGALTLMPLYAVAHGRPVEDAALLLTALIVGSILFTPIAGYAAERFGARRSLIVAATFAAAGAPFLPILIETKWAYLYLAGWGGVYYGLFSLALVEIGDRFSGARLVAVNAATGVCWGLGGVIGVPVMGGAMDVFGAEALPAGFFVLFATLAIAAWVRARMRRD